MGNLTNCSSYQREGIVTGLAPQVGREPERASRAEKTSPADRADERRATSSGGNCATGQRWRENAKLDGSGICVDFDDRADTRKSR